MVSRAQALDRAALWPQGTVPYSQIRTVQPGGWRADCSGYVSMCWALPPPGPNTVLLVTQGWMDEIPVDELQPGDALGLCGPGTAGDAGHIQLFDHWTDTGLVIWEQAGGPPGPTRRTIKRVPAGYKAYRLRGITEGDDMTPEQAEQLAWLVRTVEDLRFAVFEDTIGAQRPPASLLGQVQQLGTANAGDLAAVTRAAEQGARAGAAAAVDGATIHTRPS